MENIRFIIRNLACLDARNMIGNTVVHGVSTWYHTRKQFYKSNSVDIYTDKLSVT